MSAGTIAGELSAGSSAPLVVRLGNVSSGREVLRCDACELMQYRTTTNLCRRCHKPLPTFLPLGEAVLSAVREVLAYEEQRVVKPVLIEVRRIKINLPGALREIRRMRHLSQPQLAARMKIPRTYISKVENGRDSPGWESLKRFAEALGVNPLDLVALASEDPAEAIRAYDTIFLQELVIRKMGTLYAKREVILVDLAKAFPHVGVVDAVQ